MLEPERLLQTIYIGDRACKAVLIDSWKDRVAVQIDVISRLKPGAKTWDFDTEEDIQDGWLVFSEVSAIRFDPPGPLPNDYITSISVKSADSPKAFARFLFELSIGSVNEFADSTEVRVLIEANHLHIEDPKRPGVEIA
jgi:hypothetical protein